MELKINWNSIVAILLYHCVFVSINYVHLPSIQTRMIRIAFLLISFLLIFVKRNRLSMKKLIYGSRDKVFPLIILWGFIAAASGYINKDIPGTLMNSAVYCLSLVLYYYFLAYIQQQNEYEKVIKIYYYLTLIWLVISDVLMSTSQAFNGSNDYLIGNKFVLSYLHILWVALYYAKNSVRIKKRLNTKWILMLLHFFYTIWISFYTECSTALLASIILLILYVGKTMFEKTLRKPLFATILVCVMDSVLILYSDILNNRVIQYFIEHILHKSLTLTGRMSIYQSIGLVFSDHWAIGYGYSNSYYATSSKIGTSAPNAQNGILNLGVEFGIIGIIVFAMLLYMTIKKKNIGYSLLALIYVFIFLSSVEITFDLFFMAILGLVAYSGIDDTPSSLTKRREI